MVYPLILMYWIVLCIRVLLVWEVRILDVVGRLRPNILFLWDMAWCDLLLLSTNYWLMLCSVIQTSDLLRIQLLLLLLRHFLEGNILDVDVVVNTRWYYFLVRVLVSYRIVFYRLFLLCVDPLDLMVVPNVQPLCSQCYNIECSDSASSTFVCRGPYVWCVLLFIVVLCISFEEFDLCL